MFGRKNNNIVDKSKITSSPNDNINHSSTNTTSNLNSQNSYNYFNNNFDNISLNDVFNDLNQSLKDDVIKQNTIGYSIPSTNINVSSHDFQYLPKRKVREILHSKYQITNEECINELYFMALNNKWKEADLEKWLSDPNNISTLSNSFEARKNILMPAKLDNFRNGKGETYQSYSSLKDEIRSVLIEENYKRMQFDYQTEVLKNHIDSRFSQFGLPGNNGKNSSLTDKFTPWKSGGLTNDDLSKVAWMIEDSMSQKNESLNRELSSLKSDLNNLSNKLNTSISNDKIEMQNSMNDFFRKLENENNRNLDQLLKANDNRFTQQQVFQPRVEQPRNNKSISDKFKRIDEMIQKSINELKEVEEYAQDKNEIKDSINRFKNI